MDQTSGLISPKEKTSNSTVYSASIVWGNNLHIHSIISFASLTFKPLKQLRVKQAKQKKKKLKIKCVKMDQNIWLGFSPEWRKNVK